LNSGFKFIGVPNNIVATLVFLLVVDTDANVGFAFLIITTEFSHFTGHLDTQLDASLQLCSNQVSLVDLGHNLRELCFKYGELSLLSLDGSLFLTDAFFSLISLLLLIQALLLKFEFHLGLSFSLSLLGLFLGISVGLLRLSFGSESVDLSFELCLHLGTLGVFLGFLALHFSSKFV